MGKSNCPTWERPRTHQKMVGQTTSPISQAQRHLSPRAMRRPFQFSSDKQQSEGPWSKARELIQRSQMYPNHILDNKVQHHVSKCITFTQIYCVNMFQYSIQLLYVLQKKREQNHSKTLKMVDPEIADPLLKIYGRRLTESLLESNE